MKTTILAAASLSVLMAAAAGAADLPRAAPSYKAPATMVAENWTGFYLGVSVGARWAKADETTLSIGGGAPVGFSPVAASYDHATFRGGVYAGYNWQAAPYWVVGIEADFAWADGDKSVARLPGAFAVNPGDSSTFTQKWDAGVRARVGYLIAPTALIFLTGGAAWQDVDASATCSAATCGTALAQTNNKTLSGWTIGGGLEGMLARNWLLRLEYRYADYGTTRLTYFTGLNATVISGDVTTHTALVGIAYKFGGPVVARY